MAREIVVKFVADTKDFNKAIDESKRKLESAAGAGAKEFNNMRSAISASTVAATAFGVAAVAALKSVGSAALDAAIKIDKQVSSLKALTGSADAATKRFRELFEIAQKTPGLTTSLALTLDQQLRIFNVTERTINGLLGTVGRLNAVAPLRDPGGFVQNLTQLISGNFDKEDLKELLRASPLAGSLIKEIFNVDSPTNAEAIRTAARRLGITTVEKLAEEVIKAGEKSPALKNAVETIGGQFDKLKDRLEIALAPLGKELAEFILPTFKELVPLAEDFGRTLVKYLRENKEEITQFRKAIVDLASAFTGLGKISIPILGQLAQAASNGVGFYADLANAIQGDFSFKNSRANFGNMLPGAGGLNLSTSAAPSRFNLLGANPNATRRAAGLTGGGTARRAKTPPKDLLSGAFVKTRDPFDLKQGQKDIEDHMADLARVEIQRQRDEVQAFTGIVNAIQEGEAKRAREAEQAINVLERTSRREFTRSGRFIEDALNRGQITPAQAEALGRGSAADLAGNLRDVFARRQASGASNAVLEDLRDEIELFDRLSRSISNTESFMRGFNSQIETSGTIFDRFGARVSNAFRNVRDLFNGLKQAVLGFFNDLLGNALQSVVGAGLNSIFGGLGGSFGGGLFGGGGRVSGAGGIAAGGAGLASGAANLFGVGFGQGFGILGGGGGAAGGGGGIFGGGGLGSIFSGGKFNFSGLGTSLLNNAPILGLGLGSMLGGKSIGGNILGGIGGLLSSTFIATTLGAPGALGALAPALFSNPITAIIGAGLLVGSVFLGKAKQRKKDEEASGEFLTQALQGINQLRDAIAADQLDGSQARAIFDRDILGVFRQQIGTLKTGSVRSSRLTNQVRDLERVYNDVITPQIAAQDARKAADIALQARLQRNAITHSKLIPEFATGGTTLGGLAFLHPGEKVLNLQQQAAIRSMAGADVFNRAGVPGPGPNRNFDIGGTMSAGQEPTIEIHISNTVGVGESTAEVIAVKGLSGIKGRAVIARQVKDAKLNREL